MSDFVKRCRMLHSATETAFHVNITFLSFGAACYFAFGISTVLVYRFSTLWYLHLLECISKLAARKDFSSFSFSAQRSTVVLGRT